MHLSHDVLDTAREIADPKSMRNSWLSDDVIAVARALLSLAATRLPEGETAQAEVDQCKNCGHSRDRHKDAWAGICVGCPCPRYASQEPTDEECLNWLTSVLSPGDPIYRSHATEAEMRLARVHLATIAQLSPAPTGGEQGFEGWFDQEYPSLHSILGVDTAKSMRNVARNAWNAALASRKTEAEGDANGKASE